MNIQMLMKQAQQMQKDITKSKEEIDSMVFEGKNAFVIVKVNGKKQIVDIKFNCDQETFNDSYDMLADMIMIAANEAIKEVEKVTEEKMGKYSNMMGLL